MKPRQRPNASTGPWGWLPWAFLALLGVSCAGLTTLQYRWTGEIGRAEAARLRASLPERLEQLRETFDAELRESCMALLPTASELDEQGVDLAHANAFQSWRSLQRAAPFARVAIVIPSVDGLKLHALDLITGKLRGTEWPMEWTPLRDAFAARLSHGGPPPRLDPASPLIEFPIFTGTSVNRPGREREWMIFELDMARVRQSWLPDLVHRYLNPGTEILFDAEVGIVSSPSAILYSNRTQGQASWSPSLRRPLFTTQFGPRGRSSQGSEAGRWVISAAFRDGALEAVISAARRRSFATATAASGLIFVAGTALVLVTRRASQLAEARMSFVATVSHELRTPLTVIRGAGHNLLRGIAREPEQIAEYSRLIVKHAEQLGEMLEQTLVLAGAEHGRLALSREPLELSSLLAEAVAAASEETRAAACAVHLDLDPLLPAVTGDAAALRRVFQNLITNAAKHGGGGHWIGVSATSVNSNGLRVVEVHVTDRGSGIPAAEHSDIFKPFFRGAAARLHQIRGSGLGLSVVREIVEAHGGNVSLKSEAGHETRFTVRLPIRS